MTDTTDRQSLPYILPSQAQKHVTHNEALRQIDALTHLVFSGFERDEPPSAPSAGDTFLIGSSPEGGWIGHAGEIATHSGGTWAFYPPFEGLLAFDRTANRMLVRKDGAWIVPDTGNRFDAIAVNTDPDQVHRLAVKSDSVLFSHDDNTPGTGDMVLRINRAGTSDSAVTHHSTGWIVNAESGLAAGDSSYRVKVSADGVSFTSAMVIEPTAGRVGVGAEPGTEQVLVRRDQASQTQLGIANLGTDANASAAWRVKAANAYHVTGQINGTGAAHIFTNGNLFFGTYADKSLVIRTNTVNRLTVFGDGRVSIGTSAASAMLAVEGPARVGSFLKAALPSPAANGAGSIIFVPDATGGPVLAFSDGSAWLRVTDRTVVN